MIFRPRNIPTYNTETKQWTSTPFETKQEFSDFVDSQWGLPGYYNLTNTQYWRLPALKFQKDGRFCDFEEDTDEYKEYFRKEKKKIGQGIIVDGRYIPGEYYFYLNFSVIIDKVKGREDFPEIWDGDYHFYLYCLRAQLRGLNAVVVKARQKGFEQPVSEPVLTDNGFIPMGEIKVGTLVATPNGDFTPVLEVFDHPNKDVYELEFLDGRKVRCGIEHLWTFYQNDNLVTLSTKELKELKNLNKADLYLPEVSCIEKFGFKGSGRVKLKNITKLNYKEDSKCILIGTEDHLYLTKDFIPTHNSLKCVSRLTRNTWFIPSSVNKMIAYEEDYVNEKGSWKFAVSYRDFLNTHTGWYRDFDPDSNMNWEQKKSVTEGTYNTRKRNKGLKSKLIAATAKTNPAKAVGGGITELFCEESGIFPILDKVKGFAEAATKLGGIKTGFVVVSGAVGELKDCKPLEEYAFNPENNGFLGVEDTFSEIPSKELIGFFFPDYWNYQTEIDGKVYKFYDEHGNSDVEGAKTHLLKEEEKQRKTDGYTLWKSQHPFTLQDAFAIRDENIWPVRIIKDHQILLRQTYESLCVDLVPDDLDSSKLVHKISTWKPVNTLKIDPKKNNRGVIEIDELPPDSPKWGLFYAGVDPIRQTNTVTSVSLMSVTIWKATHMKHGKLVTEYPVARYTGRFDTWEETYENVMNLIRFYNARVAVESNVTGFHEWAISKGYSHYFMRRREIHILNEMVPNSTISDEIGVRMEGQLKAKALEFGVAYVDQVLTSYEIPDPDSKNPEDKIKKYVYGVSRLRDIMLLEEMLKFSPKLNTDRIISFVLGLMACRSNTNRSVIVDEPEPLHYRLNKPKPEVVITNHFSRGPSIKNQVSNQTIRGHFRKR